MVSYKDFLSLSLGEFLSSGHRLSESWSSGKAVFLNSEIVWSHLHVEESIHSPVVTPRVTSNPVFLSRNRVYGITNNWDFVVNKRECYLFRVNATSVKFESIGSVNTARNGTILQSSLHLCFTFDTVVVRYVISCMRCNSVTSTQAIYTCIWWWPLAISAYINCCISGLEVVGNVLFAWTVNKTDIVSIFINLSRVSSIARASSLSIDDHLSINSNRGHVLSVVHDVESISNCRCSALRPAWSTILGDVLVLVPWKIVQTSTHGTSISPINGGGKSDGIIFIPRESFCNNFFENVLFNTASTIIIVLEEIIFWFFNCAKNAVVGRLRECVNN